MARKHTNVVPPRYCDDCGLGLAPAQTTETCPRCRPEANARLMADLLRERDARRAALADAGPDGVCWETLPDGSCPVRLSFSILVF